MSREILFKAKRKNWRELSKEEWWVEGNLITNEREEGTAYIGYIFDVHNGVIEDFDIVEVDPETLCQYTGLNDKNGKRIWENDIVQCSRREKEAKYKVVWDKTYADFRIEKLNGLGVIPICIEEGNIPVYGRHYEGIGNIFDTPELLGGAE